MSAPVNPSLGNVVVGGLLGWLIFTGLVGWVTYSCVLAFSSTYTTAIPWPDVDTALQAASGAFIVAGFSVVLAAMVGIFVTLLVGVPLGWVAGRLLRSVSDWRPHVATYFVVGAIPAIAVVLGFAALDDNPYIVNLPVTLIVAALLAGTAAALGWVILWRFPARRNERSVYAESVASL